LIAPASVMDCDLEEYIESIGLILEWSICTPIFLLIILHLLSIPLASFDGFLSFICRGCTNLW